EVFGVHPGQGTSIDLAEQLAAGALERVEAEAFPEVGADDPVQAEVELALHRSLGESFGLERRERLERALLQWQRRRSEHVPAGPGAPGTDAEPDQGGGGERAGEPPEEAPAPDRNVLVGLDVGQLRAELVRILGQAALALDVRSVDAGDAGAGGVN